MSLAAIAESDLAITLENDVCGFAVDVTVTDPDGNSASLKGLSDDISQVIDPETGTAVSGRMASVALRLSSIDASSLVGRPVAIADASKRPWIVEFDDVNGASYKFKVAQSNPDRKLGVITLILELYDS